MKDLALLSGITEELLSPTLPNISASSSGVSSPPSPKIKRSHSSEFEYVELGNASPKSTAAAVESLTDTMISNILHEVTHNVDTNEVSSENELGDIIDPSSHQKFENIFMKLKFLQLSALKALIVIAGCDRLV